VTADITSLAITDTVVSDQFRYAAASRTTESVDLTDLELILNTPGDLAGEKLTVTSNTIESAVLKNMTVAEVTNYMADMVNVDAIVASDTSGFTFGTDQLSVAEIIGLTDLGYNDFADAGTAIPSTLAEGSLYYMDGTDQLSTVQDNALSVVVSDEVVDGAATTRVTLTYDSNPVVGTTHYHTRILDFAGSSTSGNPGLASEWLSGEVTGQDVLGFYNYADYGFVILDPLTSGEVITSSDATVTARVWSPKAGESLLLKVENAADSTSFEEFTVQTTVANGWEVVTWDVSGADNTKTLDKPLLFPSAGSSEGLLWYVDYIDFGNQKIDFDRGSITLVQNTTNVFNGDAWTQNLADVGLGGFVEPLGFGDGTGPDPVLDYTDTPAAGSLSFVKTAGAITYAGFYMTAPAGSEYITAGGSDSISVDVYAPAIGETVTLKLENSANVGAAVETSVTTTTAGAWETLTFDMSAADHSVTYDKLVLFPANGDTGTGQQYYFKDLAIPSNVKPFDYGNLLLNSPAAITSANTATIAEDAAAGAAVLTVTATDGEGDTIAYSLDATSLNTFDIDSATGAITLKTGVSLDHETTDSYTVTVSATDDGSNVASTQTLTVSVSDVNEAPTLTSGTTGTTVQDGAGGSTVVYTAVGADVDDGQTLTYALGGTDASSFTIDSSTGAVTLTSNADYDVKSSYSFTVTATDDGTTPLSSDPTTVTVGVQPNLISMVAEVVTLATAADDVNGFVSSDTDKYIKLTLGLDMAGLPSDYAGSKLDGVQGDLVLTGSDFLAASAGVKNSGSSTATADLGAGYVTSGNLTVNDVLASADLGSFAKGASGGLVDNVDEGAFDSVLETTQIGVIYLNVDEANVSQVTIGLDNALASEGSDTYDQADYSIVVDIV